MHRNPFLVLLSCLILPFLLLAGVTADQGSTPVVEQSHIQLVSDPGTPPNWAQPPASVQGSNNTPPPPQASGPGLPGPPSMPLSGIALLALAGGTLAYRRLRK